MSEWVESKFSDFCDITRGGSPRPIQDFMATTGTPWVKIADATASNSRYIESTKEYIKVEGESKSRVVHPGDFILSNSATPGLPRFMKIRACIHDGWLLLRNIKGVDELFLYYLLLTEREALLVQGNGSIFTNLKTEILKNHVVKLPPLPEQKAIASVLSSLDDKIDLLHRQNASLEAIAETLFRQWFDSEESSGTISQLISIQNGYAFKSSDFNDQGEHGVLKIKNISDNIVDVVKTDFINADVSENTSERFKVKTGDVLICMTGAEIGKLGIVPRTNKSLWLNQRVGLLREKYKGAKFLAYLQLKSEVGQDYILNTATGSAQPNISGTGIEGCCFPIISENKIKEYSEAINPYYVKLIYNLGQVRTLEKLRDSLLPKLISGEIRVKC